MFDQIVNDIHFKNFRIIRIKLKKNFRFCFIRNKRKTQFPLDIVSLSMCVYIYIRRLRACNINKLPPHKQSTVVHANFPPLCLYTVPSFIFYMTCSFFKVYNIIDFHFSFLPEQRELFAQSSRVLMLVL